MWHSAMDESNLSISRVKWRLLITLQVQVQPTCALAMRFGVASEWAQIPTISTPSPAPGLGHNVALT